MVTSRRLASACANGTCAGPVNFCSGEPARGRVDQRIAAFGVCEFDGMSKVQPDIDQSVQETRIRRLYGERRAHRVEHFGGSRMRLARYSY